MLRGNASSDVSMPETKVCYKQKHRTSSKLTEHALSGVLDDVELGLEREHLAARHAAKTEGNRGKRPDVAAVGCATNNTCLRTKVKIKHRNKNLSRCRCEPRSDCQL
jgi:hypothetical protein